MEVTGLLGQQTQQQEQQYEIPIQDAQLSQELYDDELIPFYLIGDILLQTNISISIGPSIFLLEIQIIFDSILQMIRPYDELMQMMSDTLDLLLLSHSEYTIMCSTRCQLYDTFLELHGQLSKQMDSMLFAHKLLMESTLRTTYRQQLEISDLE